jgi:hypothetical protein
MSLSTSIQMDIPTSYFLPFEIFNVLKLLVNNEVVICIKSIHKCLNYVIFKILDACKGCTSYFVPCKWQQTPQSAHVS